MFFCHGLRIIAVFRTGINHVCDAHAGYGGDIFVTNAPANGKVVRYPAHIEFIR